MAWSQNLAWGLEYHLSKYSLKCIPGIRIAMLVAKVVSTWEKILGVCLSVHAVYDDETAVHSTQYWIAHRYIRVPQQTLSGLVYYILF